MKANRESLIEKTKKELRKQSQQLLPDLRLIHQDSLDYYKNLRVIRKPVLIALLYKAIEKIDELEFGGEHDERDWKDRLCSEEFIFDEIVQAQIEDCELFEE